MTTFQDPPPQSRRSARQSERGEEPDAPTDFADFAPASEPTPFNAETPVARPESEVAAEPVSDDQPQSRSGRRARESGQHGLYDVPAATGGEPLEYMTQGRDEPLSYQAPEPQVPPAPRPEAQTQAPQPVQPDPQAPADPATPQFRVRDFSPEGRATGRRAAAPPLIEPGSAPSAPPSDLEYRTEVGPGTVNIPAAAAAAPTPLPIVIPAEAAAPEVIDLEIDADVEPSSFAPSPADLAEAPTPALVEPPEPISQLWQSQPIAEPIADPSQPEPQQHTLTRRELRQKMAEESAASLPTAPDPALVTGSLRPVDPALVTGSLRPVDPALVTGSLPPVDPALVTGSLPPVDTALVTGSLPPVDTALVTGSLPPVDPAIVTGTQPPHPSLITGAQPPHPSLITGAQPPPPPSASALLTGSQPPPPSAPAAYSAAPPPYAAAPPPPAPVSAPVAAPADESDPEADFEELSRTGQLAPPSASQRVTESSVPITANFVDTVMPPLPPEVEETGGWVAPVGHWSRQADLDDETQPWENTVTREVGGGNVATTTSALVLPEMPRANPFPAALNATGEILLTGSIELPRSVSSVGGDSRHFDDSDVDLMFDDKDREFSGTDSAPVSAIRAVSTHTSARGVISSANKPHGNRLLTVLLITAAVMAVGVVGLLIAGLAGQIF